MKKVFSIVLSVLLVLSLSGCGVSFSVGTGPSSKFKLKNGDVITATVESEYKIRKVSDKERYCGKKFDIVNSDGDVVATYAYGDGDDFPDFGKEPLVYVVQREGLIDGESTNVYMCTNSDMSEVYARFWLTGGNSYVYFDSIDGDSFGKPDASDGLLSIISFEVESDNANEDPYFKKAGLIYGVQEEGMDKLSGVSSSGSEESGDGLLGDYDSPLPSGEGYDSPLPSDDGGDDFSSWEESANKPGNWDVADGFVVTYDCDYFTSYMRESDGVSVQMDRERSYDVIDYASGESEKLGIYTVKAEKRMNIEGLDVVVYTCDYDGFLCYYFDSDAAQFYGMIDMSFETKSLSDSEIEKIIGGFHKG